MATLIKMTKSQERLLNLLCDNAKELGQIWFEKNKEKYSDDLYKAFRYLQDKYFKRHNLLQESVEMMSPADKKLFEKWYDSLDEGSRIALKGSCEDDFFVDEIMDAI